MSDWFKLQKMCASLRSCYKMAATLILVMVFLQTALAAVKSSYTMDQSGDCNFAGTLDLDTNQQVTIFGKSSSGTSSVTACNLRFGVKDSRDYFDLNFNSFTINDCDVVLFISMASGSSGGVSYSCQSARPGSMRSTSGYAMIRLDRRYINKNDYNFELTLRAYKPDAIAPPNDSNPMAVGLVVGIVVGVIAFFVILAILCICCYRKKRQYEQQQAAREYKQNLDDASNTTYGYDNDGRNGGPNYGDDTPGSNKKLLLEENREYTNKRGYESQDAKYREENEGDSSNSSTERKAPLIESYSMSPKKSNVFDYDNVEKSGSRNKDSDEPKSPILSALHGNPKFRASFAANEAEAEERVKRISSYSSGQDSLNDSSSFGEPTTTAKTIVKKGKVPPPPPLPNVPKSPGPKRSAFASIRRAPRPTSSSEEIQQIERGSGDYDDAQIKFMRDRDDPPSPSEVVPIKVSDPHKTKAKHDTQHTLRPNRGKSPKEKRKQSEVSPKEKRKQSEASPKEKRKQSEASGRPSRDDAYEENGHPHKHEKESDKGKKEKFQKNSGLRKSSRKSPRVGRGSGPSVGSILDDNESIGRPDTPTSQVSRFTRDDDDDDLDSNYQPLRRSASRQSLYASRSSLYGRRGKRERRGSMSESVVSYARDDIDAYSDRDFDERRVSRRESMRKNFRSLGDLEYESREISTQTLRETASQTGRGRIVSATPKKGASRKAAARKQSTSSTTSTRKPKTKKLSTKDEDELERDEENGKDQSAPSTPKSKSKAAGDKPRIQPKPKPAPRKSASAKHLPDHDTASEAGQAPESEAPTFTAASGVPYPSHMVPGGPAMTYAPGVIPGQPPQYIAPGGMPMMQPYPGAYPGAFPGAYPGQPVPPVMYAPVARMPAAQPQAPPTQAPGQPPTGKSGKSSWDILCSITDQEKETRSSDNTETASVAGSVFSQQQPNPYTPVQYPAPGGVPYPQPGYAPPGSVSYVPSSYMPTVSGGMSDFGSGQYTGSGQYPASVTSHHSSDAAGPTVVLPSVDKAFPRQASWEVLNEMASAEKHAPANSHKTESIV